jgi:hypothetical protein
VPTADDTVAVVGAAAVLGVLVVDVDLVVLVAGVPDLLATMGAAVEMLLICIYRLPLMFKNGNYQEIIGRLLEIFNRRTQASRKSVLEPIQSGHDASA